jgi:ribosomal protein L11 methyltransferase
VIANILLNTLEELAPAIASKVAPGGRLVLSGLLSDQADAAERAYAAQGLLPVARSDREGWVRLELSRAESGAG